MTIHSLELTRSNLTTQSRTARHHLDELSIGEMAKRLVVFTPTASCVEDLLSKARRSLPGLADPAAVHRVLAHNPDALWAIARRDRYNPAAPEAEGFVAFLMLNKNGLKQLADGTLNRSVPDTALLAGQHERPAGIYTWAIFAPKGLVAAVPLIYDKISSPLYANVDLYAWAATQQGKHLAEVLGFQLGAQIGAAFAPQIHHFRRARAEPTARPLYDSYRKGQTARGATVTVARDFEDLMRVAAIRSAVYIAEQDCPYDEEFDGNDLSATHLIGYIGDEPAGCLRIRYFGGFAKIERLAVRHEFRKSKLAFRLVRAALAFCQTKGYRRLYGHARTDLVNFWRRFGFEPVHEGTPFAFSDVKYVEMVCEPVSETKPISIADDPYVLIRPEGRWHEPGILERSAERGA